MAGKTRKTKVFQRLYTPIKHAVMATKESVRAVTDTARDVTCDGLTGLNRIGRSVTTHANMAVDDLLGKRMTRRRRVKKTKGRGKSAGRR